MTDEQRLLVETRLFDARRAFHDLDDKEKRETYAKEYFNEFCAESHIDPEEAYSILEEMFDNKRKTTQFKYGHYKDLRSILFDKKEQKQIKKVENDLDRDER